MELGGKFFEKLQTGGHVQLAAKEYDVNFCITAEVRMKPIPTRVK